jgi:hypothetical protein
MRDDNEGSLEPTAPLPFYLLVKLLYKEIEPVTNIRLGHCKFLLRESKPKNRLFLSQREEL